MAACLKETADLLAIHGFWDLGNSLTSTHLSALGYRVQAAVVARRRPVPAGRTLQGKPGV
jgi:hypothetical protein